MQTLVRLLTFGAIVGTGGSLLVAFAQPVPVTSDTNATPQAFAANTTAANPEKSSDSEFLKKETNTVSSPDTGAVEQPSAETKPESKIKRKLRGDGKTVRHDGKEFKEFAEPIGEGPGEDFGAPDLPAAVAPPDFPGTLLTSP